MDKIGTITIVDAHDDHLGYFIIILFLTSITFIGINVWEPHVIFEYQKLNNDYSFTTKKLINCFEIIYLITLFGSIYSYKKLNYNYSKQFKRTITWHKNIALYLTLYSQILIIAICSFLPKIQIFKKSNGFIGDNIENPDYFLKFMYLSFFIIPILLFLFFILTVKILREAQKNNLVLKN